MKKLLAILPFLFFSKAYSTPFADTTLYSLQVHTSNGAVISLGDFRDKYILFVNTASQSQFVSQYASLEQLYQQNIDSLVIIAFPSNDFGNEPSDDSTIQSFVLAQYNIHYILASKTTVSGDAQPPLYQWLTQASLNGIFNNPVKGDFFKYLVGPGGNPIGVFSGNVDPLAGDIVNAIKN